MTTQEIPGVDIYRLTPACQLILRKLHECYPRVVSKWDLLDATEPVSHYKSELDGTSRGLCSVYIHTIRKVLRAAGSPWAIVNEVGLGYRLECKDVCEVTT